MGNSYNRRDRAGAKLSFATIVLFCGLLAGPVTAAADCSENAVTLRGDWGQARFSVEIADDGAERARGLMFRETMPASAGMLFVYDQSHRASFWMRNTLIPLDMLFIDSHGVVQHIHHNAIPHDETPIDGGDNVLSVLEINGGLAKRMGITVGSELRHRVFAELNPAWPC